MQTILLILELYGALRHYQSHEIIAVVKTKKIVREMNDKSIQMRDCGNGMAMGR